MGLEPLVQSTWDDLNRSLLYLALLHLTVVTFAGSMLLARAVIPSLVYTGHASERVGRLQPVFYGLAVLAGVGVVILAYLWISSTGFMFELYDRTYY
ncbi:hypothetical protein BH23CHL2_BH23CHL2_13570 [soil metagenome]